MTDRLRVHFDVVGLPSVQGSKATFRNQYTGKIQVVEGGTPAKKMKFAEWRAAVMDEGRRQAVVHGTLDGELHAQFTFYLAKPKTAPKWKEWVSTTPDFDKLARAVCDALKLSTLIVDDSRIVECLVVKRYAIDRQPGASITIIVGSRETEQQQLLVVTDGATRRHPSAHSA